MVGHNIHGTIHDDPVTTTLGGRSNPNPYGITAVYDAGAVPLDLENTAYE